MRVLKAPQYMVKGHTVELTITVDRNALREVTEFIDSVNLEKDITLTAEVKRTEPSEKVKKMSWILIDRLAHKLRASKSEVHEAMLERYGAIATDENGEPKIYEVGDNIPLNELKKFLGDHLFEVDKGNGKKIVKVVKSTTEMDNVEFAAYVDGIMSECQEVGIKA